MSPDLDPTHVCPIHGWVSWICCQISWLRPECAGSAGGSSSAGDGPPYGGNPTPPGAPRCLHNTQLNVKLTTIKEEDSHNNEKTRTSCLSSFENCEKQPALRCPVDDCKRLCLIPTRFSGFSSMTVDWPPLWTRGRGRLFKGTGMSNAQTRSLGRSVIVMVTCVV